MPRLLKVMNIDSHLSDQSSDQLTRLTAADSNSVFLFPVEAFSADLMLLDSAMQAKSLLQQYQAKIDQAFRDGHGIEELIQARSMMIDSLLQYCWKKTDWGTSQICLVAVGGYGRGELHPQSDVDLLIILNQSATSTVAENISFLVTYLWDCGLDLGHSVRTLDECVSYAKQDITVLTNMLESRPIAGDTSLFNQLKQLTDVSQMWSSSEFFMAKWQEQRDRHKNTDDTDYNLEPNVKTSPGGLRDIQNIIWIAKRHLGEGDIEQLASKGFLTDIEAINFVEGMRFLWKVRYALHMLANRHEDRLLFDYQVKVAEFFDFIGDDANLAVEKFMHEYYRRVLLLAELNDVLIQNFDPSLAKLILNLDFYFPH